MSAVVSERSPCIFCNIVNKSENTEILFEDDDVCVFRDIKPATRFHVLTIPKRHIEDARSLTSADKELGFFIMFSFTNKPVVFKFVHNFRRTHWYECFNLNLPSHECEATVLPLPPLLFDVIKILAVAKDVLSKNNLSLSDARFGYHWPPFRSVKHLHLHAIAPESEMGFISRMVFLKDSFWFVSPDYVVSRL